MASNSTARVMDHDAIRRGIHLVKSGTKEMNLPVHGMNAEPAERVNLLPLAIAALAAPTVWCLHELLRGVRF